jgi:transposase InsO family protein
MPWKETCAMEEREAFVRAWWSGQFTMSELCQRFAVSRPTGYKWMRRGEAEGRQGLVERSRAPHRHPNATVAAQVAAIVALKRQHVTWGPVAIHAWLYRERPAVTWPAVSTIGEILKRHGLVQPRTRGRPPVPPHTQPFAAVRAPNDVWSADFKGHFPLGDGRRCHPLTISDNYSRYLLCCHGMYRPEGLRTRACFEAVFREYGLPRALRTDNGVPFASIALGGLSALAVWLVKLDVMPERIEPGQPQQNGRHERMHRTLKAATAKPPKGSLSAQQRAFNHFRHEYNDERPHRALGGGRRPGELYRPSTRVLPVRTPAVSYPDHFAIRKVRQEGHMKWEGHEVFVSKTLAGEPVGLKPLDHDRWELYFGRLPLGILDARTHKIVRPGSIKV